MPSIALRNRGAWRRLIPDVLYFTNRPSGCAVMASCKMKGLLVLDTLDSIDWARLTHAAGSAHDVPDMIRQLLSDKASVRERALDERGLWGTLCHQDSIYEATAPAVPFLLELAREPTVQGRGKILDLLVYFAQGGYQDPDQAEAELQQTASTLTLEERKQAIQEIDWTRQTRAAVRAGCSIYLSLLSDRVYQVRRSALRVLIAACQADGALVTRAIRDRIDHERNRAMRTALIRSIAHFMPVTQETHTFLAQIHARDTDALAQLNANIVLAEIEGEQASVEVVTDLVQALVHPDRELHQEYEKLFTTDDDNGDYEGDIATALQRIGDRGVMAAINEIEREAHLEPIEQLPDGRIDTYDRWRRGPDGRDIVATLHGRSTFPLTPSLSLMYALLRLTFDAHTSTATDMASLSPLQRRVLALVCGCESAWYYDLTMQNWLFDLGIPHTRESLQSYLDNADH